MTWTLGGCDAGPTPRDLCDRLEGCFGPVQDCEQLYSGAFEKAEAEGCEGEFDDYVSCTIEQDCRVGAPTCVQPSQALEDCLDEKPWF